MTLHKIYIYSVKFIFRSEDKNAKLNEHYTYAIVFFIGNYNLRVMYKVRNLPVHVKFNSVAP